MWEKRNRSFLRRDKVRRERIEVWQLKIISFNLQFLSLMAITIIGPCLWKIFFVQKSIGVWNPCYNRRSGAYWSTTKINYRPEAEGLEGQELSVPSHWSNHYGDDPQQRHCQAHLGLYEAEVLGFHKSQKSTAPSSSEGVWGSTDERGWECWCVLHSNTHHSKQDEDSWWKHATSGDHWKDLEINDLKVWLCCVFGWRV